MKRAWDFSCGLSLQTKFKPSLKLTFKQVLFLLEIVINPFREKKNWMKCLNSIISFYIYLENESDTNPNQNFVSWLQLGDRSVNTDTETASVKALSRMFSQARGLTWIELDSRVSGLSELCRNKFQVDGTTVQICMIAQMQNLSWMTRQWHLFCLNFLFIYNPEYSAWAITTSLLCWKGFLRSSEYSVSIPVKAGSSPLQSVPLFHPEMECSCCCW